MAYSLVKQPELLIGKSKPEIIDILGNPSREAPEFVSFEINRGNILKKIDVARDYVVIEFDEETGTVKKISIADA